MIIFLTVNKTWIEKHLSTQQKNIWFSENLEEINIQEENNDKEKMREQEEKNRINRIQHHFDIAKNKIKEINLLGFEFQTNFQDIGELQKYFNLEIKKIKKEIIEKEGGENLFNDLQLQINEISKLKRQKGNIKHKKINKIIICRELDPLKILMMGNWVQGSCLSFYHDVKNYYSAVSNAIDANKAVFYIKDENGGLLGRCLMTIGNDNKLSRYKMYYAKNTNIDIDGLFDEYTKELSRKMQIELNGEENKVENIECDKWYKDGIKIIE